MEAFLKSIEQLRKITGSDMKAGRILKSIGARLELNGTYDFSEQLRVRVSPNPENMRSSEDGQVDKDMKKATKRVEKLLKLKESVTSRPAPRDTDVPLPEDGRLVTDSTGDIINSYRNQKLKECLKVLQIETLFAARSTLLSETVRSLGFELARVVLERMKLCYQKG
ncbi:hypothetical protein BC833DRAFT_636844 [Globomyces pollinis-pini]|nr:hypothetical protein BC833DRAFT_636844 [Globomyces pollinis-pini]